MTSSGIELYDSVNATAIPRAAGAQAGYVDGRWPSYPGMRNRLPHIPAISITVRGGAAMVADCESGDLPPAAAAAWVARMALQGFHRPAVYTSLAQVAELVDALSEHGLERSSIRLWTAHWTAHRHRCGGDCLSMLGGDPAGATQYVPDVAGCDVSSTTTGWIEGLIRAYRRMVL